MKVENFTFCNCGVSINIRAENGGEAALLSHFHAKEHVAILCGGPYVSASNQGEPYGLQLFIREKTECEYRGEIEDGLGRKKKLERRSSRRVAEARRKQ
jgi:hypothetical protein